MRQRTFHLSRRGFLASTAALATTLRLDASSLASDAAACILTAEQEEGPYYIPDELFRSDIAESKPGIPLTLRILLKETGTCKPLTDAVVEIWHCDAMGLYSGFTQQSMMGPGGPHGPGDPQGPPPGFQPGSHDGPPGGPGGPPPKSQPSDKLTFLRGIQRNAPDGVFFKTVFPGFYMGRTNHIHFKVRIGGHASGKTYNGGHIAHTGQIFFPEDLTAQLMQQEPYSLHTIHRTTQIEDDIFEDQHGGSCVAFMHPISHAVDARELDSLRHGILATAVAFIDPRATPPPVERRGGPHPPPSSD